MYPDEKSNPVFENSELLETTRDSNSPSLEEATVPNVAMQQFNAPLKDHPTTYSPRV
jgi:hypothetical protein